MSVSISKEVLIQHADKNLPIIQVHGFSN